MRMKFSGPNRLKCFKVISHSWYLLAPLAVLAMGAALATGLWWREQKIAETLRLQDFHRRSDEIQIEITRRFRHVEELTGTIRAGFFARPTMSAAEWQNFVNGMGLLPRFPEIIVIGFIKDVKLGDLANFLATERENYPGFQISPPGVRPEYMVTALVAPSAPVGLGFDSGTSSVRRKAMELARDTGQIEFAHQFQGGENTDVVAAYLPVYAPDHPIATREERASAIMGWVGAGFSMPLLMEGVVRTDEAADLEIYDGDPSAENLLLATGVPGFGARQASRILSSSFNIAFAGRNYTVRFASSAKKHASFAGAGSVIWTEILLGLLLAIVMQGISSRLRQREARLKLVLASSQDGFWDWDVAAGKVYFSPQFWAILGYPDNDQERHHKNWKDLVHPMDIPLVRARFLDHFKGRTSRVEHEYRLLTGKGDWLWVRESAAVTQRTGPRVARVSGTISDISMQRRVADHLQLLSSVVEESPASVVITDSDGLIFYVNRAFQTISGYKAGEVIGFRPSLLKSGLTRDSVYKELWATITAGRQWRGELCNKKKNGDIFWEDVCITQVRGIDGRIFYFGIKVDITERKQTESALLRSQKLQAIGTLAGGVAHDFNNILTSILGYNHLIPGDMNNPELVIGHVQQIHAAGTRAKDLVRQILTFSRQHTSFKTPVDLGEVVSEVFYLIRTTAPVNIRVSLDLPPARAMVLGISTQLHQAVMNLCINSIDAIGQKVGTIAICLNRRAGRLILSVADSGPGIAPEILPRIFDPFFTTKGTGQGSGLGLSVVHGIVEGHEGSIEVESPPEGGVRFLLDLPELIGGEDGAKAPDMMPALRKPRESRHILVVDDDYPTVNLLELFFKRIGHRVSATTRATEALGWIQDRGRFDVVITDQMMPDLTGTELAGHVAQLCPGTKVVLCSGREDMIDYDEIATRVDAFVVKPFNLIELADTVESLLREGDGSD